MSGTNLSSGFPPSDSVLRWQDPAGAEVEAAILSWRESGAFRVYNLRVAGDDVTWTGVMDCEPDSGRLTLVVSRPGGELSRVAPEIRTAQEAGNG